MFIKGSICIFISICWIAYIAGVFAYILKDFNCMMKELNWLLSDFIYVLLKLKQKQQKRTFKNNAKLFVSVFQYQSMYQKSHNSFHSGDFKLRSQVDFFVYIWNKGLCLYTQKKHMTSFEVKLSFTSRGGTGAFTVSVRHQSAYTTSKYRLLKSSIFKS